MADEAAGAAAPNADAGAASAAAAAAAAPDAAAKAAADKAAADAAAQTPEQKAAAEKVAADKVVADKAAADKVAADRTAAIKTALKLPENSTLDPAVLEKTTAIASESGLSPEIAQKVVGLVDQVAAAHATKAIADWQASQVKGGKAFEARNTEYQAAALKDPDLGNGNPAQLAQRSALASRALATLFPSVIDVIKQAGLESHPGLVKDLYRAALKMKEDDFVVGSGAPSTKKVRDADVLYGGTTAAPK